MTYTDTLDALATSTEAVLTGLYARWEAAQITGAQFRILAVAALLRAGARGVGMADLALAAFLSVDGGRPVPALGLALPASAPARYTAAVALMLAGAVTPESVAVLGRSETLATAQDAYADGMRQHGVGAWTRVLNAGACELCHDLAGDVLPVSADMYHHKGCGCTQRPITGK